MDGETRMWVSIAGQTEEGIALHQMFQMPLEGGDSPLHPYPLEGNFPPIYDRGLQLQWMEKVSPSDWTLCIYKAKMLLNPDPHLFRGRLVLIKPTRNGDKWRVLGPPGFEWRLMSGPLLGVIEEAVDLLAPA